MTAIEKNELTLITDLMSEISVIIPAHNEERTIQQVILKAQQGKTVREVIVVDNCSTDSTYELAKEANARVIKCNKKGKGYAMELGIKKAKYPIIVFLDADINGYDKNIINILANPIIEKNVGFVKSTFDRSTGGKVTEIATKPLLNILFPEMYNFSEPLSGMIASKKSILEKLYLEKDYGVDIGILLDMIKMNVKIEEINIGRIKNNSHTFKTQEKMGQMSTEVMRAILKRAPVEVKILEEVGI